MPSVDPWSQTRFDFKEEVETGTGWDVRVHEGSQDLQQRRNLGFAAAPQRIAPAIPYDGGDSFPIASEKRGGLGRPPEQERWDLAARGQGVSQGGDWGNEGPLAEAVRRALSTRLATLTKRHVELTITDNRCSLLHARDERQTLFLRLHHMFLDAPDGTVRALARYLARGDRKAGAAVDAFIQENQTKVSSGPPPRRALRTAGAVHDLERLFSELNRTWFADALDVRVTWGRRTSPRQHRRRSLRLGVYVFSDRLIRIHPVLDQDWVPEFFVRYVLFHEMLHAVTPPEDRGGKKAYHGPQFRKRERAYPDYQRAIEWERANLDQLLSS